MKFFIYYLLCPLGKVRYVGYSQRPKSRFNGHLRQQDTTHKSYWIQSLLRVGEKPSLAIKCVVQTEEEAWRIETHLISSLRANGAALTNSAPGGEGRSGPLPLITKERIRAAMKKPEVRAKISAGRKGKPGRVWTDEQRTKSALNNTGKFHTPESIAKMKATHLGKKLSVQHREAISKAQAGIPNPKHSAIMLGRKESPERCEIQRQGALKRWAKYRVEKAQAAWIAALKEE